MAERNNDAVECRLGRESGHLTLYFAPPRNYHHDGTDYPIPSIPLREEVFRAKYPTAIIALDKSPDRQLRIKLSGKLVETLTKNYGKGKYTHGMNSADEILLKEDETIAGSLDDDLTLPPGSLDKIKL